MSLAQPRAHVGMPVDLTVWPPHAYGRRTTRTSTSTPLERAVAPLRVAADRGDRTAGVDAVLLIAQLDMVSSRLNDVVQRGRDLLQLAANSGASPGEVATAALVAARLLIEHPLRLKQMQRASAGSDPRWAWWIAAAQAAQRGAANLDEVLNEIRRRSRDRAVSMRDLDMRQRRVNAWATAWHNSRGSRKRMRARFEKNGPPSEPSPLPNVCTRCRRRVGAGLRTGYGNSHSPWCMRRMRSQSVPGSDR